MPTKFARMTVRVSFARNDGVDEQWAEFVDNDPMSMQLQPEWLDDSGSMLTHTEWQLVRALHNLKQAVQSDPIWQASYRDCITRAGVGG